MLQYDNSAFYFFCLSFLSFYLIPSWWSLVSQAVSAFSVSDETIGAVSRTSQEKTKADQLKKESRGSNSLFTRGYLIHLGLTILVTLIFMQLAVSVSNDGEVNSFDPFSILQIDSSADNKQIKKAYRSLSLKYHPDKNPNNRAAEAKFMMVSKAYEALTDETAKENWEKFGNPDGKQSLEVSIGLPSLLLDSANRNLVLIVYLILMVVVIPFCVWKYYTNSSKFGEKDIMYETYSWFHHTLSEHTLVKSLPELLSGCAEFRKCNMPKSVKEKEEIGGFMSKIRLQMQKPKYNHPVCVKGNVLFHAHLLRKSNLLDDKPELKSDLRHMLKLSNSLIEAMISVCQHQDSLQTAINCIEFSQFVSQAMWLKDSTLLQLPHFTNAEIQHVEKGKSKVKDIIEYRDQPEKERKGLADFTDEQKQDVAEALKLLPDIEVTTKVFVDDDEDDKVYEGDLCVVKVRIERKNLAEGEKAGLVHAPHFPYPRKEAWWVILGTKEGKIISIEKVTDNKRIFEHSIKFLAPRKGQYEFELIVKSNAYVGLDKKMKVELETLDSSVLPEYKIHPEDAELDDEPTLFEEILNAHIEDDSDDDDSDDDDDDGKESENASAPSTANKKKQQLQKARQQPDDDSDDDSDDAEEVYADK